jgi:hypothetical protein
MAADWLALASIVIHDFQFHGTHDHVLHSGGYEGLQNLKPSKF